MRMPASISTTATAASQTTNRSGRRIVLDNQASPGQASQDHDGGSPIASGKAPTAARPRGKSRQFLRLLDPAGQESAPDHGHEPDQEEIAQCQPQAEVDGGQREPAPAPSGRSTQAVERPFEGFQLGFAHVTFNRAASTVFFRSMATVMAPTPPGTGVMSEATWLTLGK